MGLITVLFFRAAVAALQLLAVARQGQQAVGYRRWCHEQNFRFGEVTEFTQFERERWQGGARVAELVIVKQRIKGGVSDLAKKGQGQMEIADRYPAPAAQRQLPSPMVQAQRGRLRHWQGKEHPGLRHCGFAALIAKRQVCQLLSSTAGGQADRA